ncbi:hypothetical protein [Burkholderia sp. Bp9143]|nr:hypothetical protein [Burkholderia sp. Bp9143]
MLARFPAGTRRPRPNFSVANEAAISTAPVIDFSTQPTKANAAGQ